jgi:hypothetical protein
MFHSSPGFFHAATTLTRQPARGATLFGVFLFQQAIGDGFCGTLAILLSYRSTETGLDVFNVFFGSRRERRFLAHRVFGSGERSDLL